MVACLAALPGLPPRAGGPPARKAPADDRPPRTDRQGDPLPAGALARLGTVRFRNSGPVVSLCQHHTIHGPATTVMKRELHLRVWDLASGKETRRVANEMMHRATCSPDGPLLAGGMHKIGVWEAATGRERARLDQPGRVFALAFTPEGRRLVSSEFAWPIRVWEVATGSEVRRLAGHDTATRP